MRPVACIALLLLSAGSMQAEPLFRGVETLPLRGAVDFCKRNPGRCVPHAEAVVHMSARRMAELVKVNKIVNNGARFEEELPGVDVWKDDAFGAGDCEDFALRKKRLLVEEYEWPAGALYLVIVEQKRADRELHVVLVAVTDEDSFVLDAPSGSHAQLRVWDPRDFYRLSMMWRPDGKWYTLLSGPATAVARNNP